MCGGIGLALGGLRKRGFRVCGLVVVRAGLLGSGFFGAGLVGLLSGWLVSWPAITLRMQSATSSPSAADQSYS